MINVLSLSSYLTYNLTHIIWIFSYYYTTIFCELGYDNLNKHWIDFFLWQVFESLATMMLSDRRRAKEPDERTSLMDGGSLEGSRNIQLTSQSSAPKRSCCSYLETPSKGYVVWKCHITCVSFGWTFAKFMKRKDKSWTTLWCGNRIRLQLLSQLLCFFCTIKLYLFIFILMFRLFHLFYFYVMDTHTLRLHTF